MSQSQQEEKQKSVKLITLGNSFVGKSSLIECMIEGKVFETPNVRQVNSKILTIDNNHIKINIWDTCGQEKYNCVHRGICREVDCCLLCFDLSDEESFNSLNKWKEFFIESTNYIKSIPTPPPIVLIGCKSDLIQDDKRQISNERIIEWCNKNNNINIPYFEVSSILNLNIKETLTIISKLAYDHRYKSIYNNNNSTIITIASNNDGDNNNKRSMCNII